MEMSPHLDWSVCEGDIRDVLFGINNTSIVFLELESLLPDAFSLNIKANSSSIFLQIIINSILQMATIFDFPASSSRVSYLSELNGPSLFSDYQLKYTLDKVVLTASIKVLKSLKMFLVRMSWNTAILVSSTNPPSTYVSGIPEPENIRISTIALFNNRNQLAGLFTVQGMVSQVRMPSPFGHNLLEAGAHSQITVETNRGVFDLLESVLIVGQSLSTVKLEIQSLLWSESWREPD